MRRALGLLALACGGSLLAALACGLPVSGLLAGGDSGVTLVESGAGDGGGGHDGAVDATLDAARDSSPRDSASADEGDAPPGCTTATCAVDLALGPFHSCAILAGGGVHCWGSNEKGQLGFGVVVDGSVVPGATATPGAVAVGAPAIAVALGGLLSGATPPVYGPYSCALFATGAITCWGSNFAGELGGGAEAGIDNAAHLIPALADIGGATQLAAGGLHACALAGDAAVQCWGDDDYVQLGRIGFAVDPTPGPPSPLPAAPVAQIATGGYNTCVREQTGGVECWGLDAFGQNGRSPPGGSQVDPATAPVAGVGGVVQIAAGYVDVCAVLDGGSVACWGYNAQGQLGRGAVDSYEFAPAPVALPPGPPVVQVSVGAFHACAVRQDGSLWCWGHNSQGQLGVGAVDVDSGAVTPSLSATPMQVLRLPAVARVACGGYHTCALLQAGPVLCWGANGSGQLGGGPGDAGDGGGIDQLAHVVPVVVAF